MPWKQTGKEGRVPYGRTFTQQDGGAAWRTLASESSLPPFPCLPRAHARIHAHKRAKGALMHTRTFTRTHTLGDENGARRQASGDDTEGDEQA
eukprot:10909630-Alexandrium_andersonii.AAC.1